MDVVLTYHSTHTYNDNEYKVYTNDGNFYAINDAKDFKFCFADENLEKLHNKVKTAFAFISSQKKYDMVLS